MPSKKKIYVAGPLTHGGTQELRSIYEKIGHLCAKLGFNSYIPHMWGNDPEKNPEVEPREIWEKNFNQINSSSVIIAYAGRGSFGTGAELELARISNTKIIIWLFENEKASRMALGNPGVTQVLKVQNEDDLLRKLENILNEI
jgi:hypothetical protein